MAILYQGNGVTISRAGMSDNYTVSYELIDGTTAPDVKFKWDGSDVPTLLRLLAWARQRGVSAGGYLAPTVATDANISTAFTTAFGVSA